MSTPTQSRAEESRAQFEAWAKDKRPYMRLHVYSGPDQPDYIETETKSAWLAWSAREERVAALEAEVARLKEANGVLAEGMKAGDPIMQATLEDVIVNQSNDIKLLRSRLADARKEADVLKAQVAEHTNGAQARTVTDARRVDAIAALDQAREKKE